MSIFQKGRGSLWKVPSEKTRCEHNALICIFCWFLLTAYIFWVFCGWWVIGVWRHPKWMTNGGQTSLENSCDVSHIIWDTFNILLNHSHSINPRKRNSIARRKSTKINVHFSKGLWDLVKMGYRKTRCMYNYINCDFCWVFWTAYFLSVLSGKGFREKSASNIWMTNGWQTPHKNS